MQGLIKSVSVNSSCDGKLSTEVNMTLYGYVDHRQLTDIDFNAIAPGPALIKCAYCGQWAAKFTACVHCGAAVG
jgi:hypothetical protein